MGNALSMIGLRRLAALALCTLLGALTSACSYATVGAGEVAVVWTPEGVRPKVYPEGEWQINF